MRRVRRPPPSRGGQGAFFFAPALGVVVEGFPALLQVSAGAEASAFAGHDDGANVVVGVRRVQGGDHLVHHGVVERIQSIGPIQGEGQHPALELIANRFKVHLYPLRSVRR